jgi:hypothetical protein
MANLVYTFCGTVTEFNTTAATSGTTLNTNLAAGYGVQSVVPQSSRTSTGEVVYLWVLQNGTVI